MNVAGCGDDVTLVSLVCGDPAQLSDAAKIIRSVGPTAVIAPLLDGPQLATRWAARSASVLADHPGASVLTLSACGMVQRSRPPWAQRRLHARSVEGLSQRQFARGDNNSTLKVDDARGNLRARVGTVLALDQARKAHEMLDGAPHRSGQIVLSVADPI